jgi:hypothetical protein
VALSIAGICRVSQRSAGTGPTWSRPVTAMAATPPSARDLRPWARCDDDPPACRPRLHGDFMPMPAHQDRRDACGEMRWSHLVPVMPGPASPSRSRMTVAAGEASGSVNRSCCPDSVRYMSVTTAAQRRLLTDDDTPGHLRGRSSPAPRPVRHTSVRSTGLASASTDSHGRHRPAVLVRELAALAGRLAPRAGLAEGR